MEKDLSKTPIRCGWAGVDPLYVKYHDSEWGVPIDDDRTLFEFLILEGAQAGLSWITILRKRENYRKAFSNFDPSEVADYTDKQLDELMNNPGIIRNRRKIVATVLNARAFLKVQAEFGSFAGYLWSFVGYQPVQNHWDTLKDVPAQTVESQSLSRDLQNRGFKFVGPTICYSLMQAVGLVNDHTVNCFRHEEVRNLAKSMG